jgi:hypothetical protein
MSKIGTSLSASIKADLESRILNAIDSQIDELKHLQEGGWEIDLDDPVGELLDMQSSFSLRDSLLEEPVEMRKQGQPLSESALEEARAYIEEILAKVELLSLRAFKEKIASGTFKI